MYLVYHKRLTNSLLNLNFVQMLKSLSKVDKTTSPSDANPLENPREEGEDLAPTSASFDAVIKTCSIVQFNIQGVEISTNIFL